MNKLKDGKILYIILSVLIASAFWLYVVSEVNPDATATVRGIPVVITGEDVLDSRDLMITQRSAQELDVRFTGKRNSLVKLTQDNVLLSVDVSSIAGEGEYDLRCNVSTPNTITTGTVSLEDREGQRVKLTVEKKASKTVEIRGEFKGGLAEGYQGETFILSPSSMVISGPADLLDTIDHALVTLEAQGLNTTYSGILPFEFVTHDGLRIGTEGIQTGASTIYVVYPVVMVREVELVVNFTPGGGATEEHVTYEVSPNTIQISGKEADVTAVKEIILADIDLAKVADSGSYTVPIVLSEELTNESGVTEATVTVKVEGLSTKTVETDNIEIVNPPAGYVSQAVTQSLRVAVRGTEEAVADVFPHNLRVVADLSEVTASTGQFRVPVKVYLDGGGEVGVVGAEYTISVSLSR